MVLKVLMPLQLQSLRASPVVYNGIKIRIQQPIQSLRVRPEVLSDIMCSDAKPGQYFMFFLMNN